MRSRGYHHDHGRKRERGFATDQGGWGYFDRFEAGGAGGAGGIAAPGARSAEPASENPKPFASHVGDSTVPSDPGTEVEYALDDRIACVIGDDARAELPRGGCRILCDLVFDVERGKSSIRLRSGESLPVEKKILAHPRPVRTAEGTTWRMRVKSEAALPPGDSPPRWKAPFGIGTARRVCEAIAKRGWVPGSLLSDGASIALTSEGNLEGVSRSCRSVAASFEGSTFPCSAVGDVGRVLGACSVAYLTRRWDVSGPRGAMCLSVYERSSIRMADPPRGGGRSRERERDRERDRDRERGRDEAEEGGGGGGGGGSWYVGSLPAVGRWTVEIEVVNRAASVSDIAADVRHFAESLPCLRPFLPASCVSPCPARAAKGTSWLVNVWPPPPSCAPPPPPGATVTTPSGKAGRERFFRSVESVEEVERRWASERVLEPRAYTERRQAVEATGRALVTQRESSGRVSHRRLYPLLTSRSEAEARLRSSYVEHGTFTLERAMRCVSFVMRHRRVGIFVSIRASRIALFLPFFDLEYRNRFGSRHIAEGEYCNGPLLCDRPDRALWTMSQVPALHFLVAQAAAGWSRQVDCDLFLNPRDSSILRKDGRATEHLAFADERAAAEQGELELAQCAHFVRILSQFTSPNHADHPMPSRPDVELAFRAHFVPCRPLGGDGRKEPTPVWDIAVPRWEDRRKCAVFRGTLTGPSHDPRINQRVLVCEDCLEEERRAAGAGEAPSTDCGLVGLTKRRRLAGRGEVSDPPSSHKLAHLMRDRLAYEQQVAFAGAVLVEGNQAANRFGTLLYLGFLVFRVSETCECPGTWIDSFARAGVHYVSVEGGPRHVSRVAREYLSGPMAEEGRRIAERGMALARDTLSRPETLIGYVGPLLSDPLQAGVLREDERCDSPLFSSL